MRAVVYDRFGQLPVLRDVAAPAAPADGAVIEVRAAGVCRSDWHAWMGHDPDVRLPHVGGHELAGVVAEVGALVERWAPGDRVTAPFVNACGRCEVCAEGNQTVCPAQTQPGFTHWGAFADQVVIHAADTNLVALPDSVDFLTAASLGCRFATAYRAVAHLGGVGAGQWVAVYGAGGVGLAAVMVATSRHARVVAVDVSPGALAMAGSVGAEHLVDPRHGDAAERIQELTGGVHVSVDAIGRSDTLATALRSLRRRGRHVQIGLLLAEHATPPVDMGLVIARELQIVGSHGMAAHDYPAMLAEMAGGRLDPARLVTRTIRLDEAAAELAGMDGRRPPGITVVVTDDAAGRGATASQPR